MSEHWLRLSQQLDELLDLDARERAGRLAALAVTDAALAAELTRLLAADERSGMLDDGVVRAAPTVMSRIAADIETPSARTEAGKHIGHYRLIERIGSGGMGEVWRGERGDGEFEQQVAIKLIRPLLDSPHLRERFARERRILARLDHPNIARLLDGGVSDDGTPWYAMEFVRGTDIVRFANEHSLDTRERVELLLQVCDAVAHAQTLLVVHRDLKPSNILVDGEGRARVLDFGIARLLDDTADTQLTSTGVRMFSPMYAAPEQIRGEPAGTATDVYALGVVLYELLTGEVPHPHRSTAPDRLLVNLHEEVLVRPSKLLRQRADGSPTQGQRTARHAREISGDLDTVVATALQSEPPRRYAGAAQLGDDLRRWLDGRPIAAQPDTAGYRVRKFVARHRIAVGSASAVLLALIAGLGLALWQADVARRHAARADLEARRASEQALVAQAVSDFLTRDLIQAANPYRSTVDIKLTDALVKAGQRIDARFADNLHLAGVLHGELADALYLAGAPAAGRDHAERAVQALQRSQPADGAELLQARFALARILHTEKRYADSRASYEAALAALPPNAPDRLRLPFQVGLAGLLVDQQGEEEALRQLDALQPAIAALPEFGQVQIDALNHRMRAQIQLDRFDDCLATARELRAAAELNFGVGDPRTFEWVRREAIALTALERYDEALSLLERGCAATTAALGTEHPSVQECRLRQGVVLFELERFAEAAALIEPVAALRERTLPREHETLWTTWVWAARVHQRLGRLAEARVLFERARDTAAEVLGSDHTSALPFEQTLGMFFEQTGQQEEALRLRTALLERAKQALSEGHVNIAKYAWDLAETLASQQRDGDLIALCAEWAPRWLELFGPEDGRVVDAQGWLAAAKQRSEDALATRR